MLHKTFFSIVRFSVIWVPFLGSSPCLCSMLVIITNHYYLSRQAYTFMGQRHNNDIRSVSDICVSVFCFFEPFSTSFEVNCKVKFSGCLCQRLLSQERALSS